MSNSSSTTVRTSRTPYFMGIVTGASLALAAFTMMGQGYSRPNDPKAPAGTAPAGGAPAAAVETDTFFATAGNTANTSARLWKKPAGRNTLEYIGEFQAAGKGGR